MPARLPFRGRPLVYTLGSLAALLPLTLYVNDHVAQLMWIRGASMAPFLNGDFDISLQRDVVLVQMWAPWRNVKRGSVVTFWYVDESAFLGSYIWRGALEYMRRTSITKRSRSQRMPLLFSHRVIFRLC
jgi:signal peptidase I